MEVNRLIKDLLGMTLDDMRGKDTEAVVAPHTRLYTREQLALVSAGIKYDSDATLLSPDGSLIYIDVTFKKLDNGNFIGFLFDKTSQRALDRQAKLLSAVNLAGQTLLSDDQHFHLNVWKVLEMLGTASGADRTYIWRNHRGEDGRLYTTQIYEWSGGATPQADLPITQEIAFDEMIPGWEEKLTNNQCVNNFVRLMSQGEQDQLSPQGILSILVAPIIFHGNFWGFIGFDDCTRERIWDSSEEAILRAAGVLLATAINRQTMSRAVSESNQRFHDISDATGEIIWEVDTEQKFTYISDRLLDVFGVEPSEMIGKTASRFIVPEDYVRYFHEMERLLQGEAEKYVNLEFLNTNYNGNKIWIRVSGKAIYSPETKKIIGIRGTCQDVTAEREAAEKMASTLMQLAKANLELEQMAKKAEQASIAKSQFLATMSHEIRTPLNGVIGMSDLLAQTGLSTKQKEYVELIHESGKTLLFLINDILDFSKIEAGKLEINTERFDLHSVVDSALNIMANRANQKGLEICGIFAPNVPHDVYGDEGRIQQVLLNLIGNSVKFTENGGVSVRIFNEGTDPNQNGNIIIRFTIHDTGIGISDEQVNRLFKAFSQVDSSTTRKRGGTGLGLVISEQLAKLMGGYISVESEPGKGSIFTFTISVKTLPDSEIAPHRKSIAEKLKHGDIDLSHRMAIVVEDNDVLRSVLDELLKNWGMNCSAYRNKQEALAAFQKAKAEGHPFQLAIIDNTLSDASGAELYADICSYGVLPVVFLRSLGTDENILEKHEKQEHFSLVSKPVHSSTLFNAILEAIVGKIKYGEINKPIPKQTRYIEHTESPAGESDACPVFAGARILVAEDNRINQVVVKEILKKAMYEFDIVENGSLACEAFMSKEYDAILMDCQMPEMDGYEATRFIREIEMQRSDSRIPIIALTANATKGDEERCLSAGMDAYCVKPINPAVLLEKIGFWLHSKHNGLL